MSNIDQGWAATTAESGFEDDVVPPAGWLGIIQVVGTRAGLSKKGETYFAVDLKDASGEYHWALYKQITTNGVYQDGKGKSAKITLRQLGVDENIAWPLVDAALKAKLGQWFAVEQKASTTLNKTTGFPFVNTEIVGVASAPAQVTQSAQPVTHQPVHQYNPDGTIVGAPDSPQAQPQTTQYAQQDGMAMTAQPGPATFPPAVAGTAPTVVAPQQQGGTPTPAQTAMQQDNAPY